MARWGTSITSILYDALFVMQDEETKTLWRHIDGQVLCGRRSAAP
jgi:hypothetical protein